MSLDAAPRPTITSEVHDTADGSYVLAAVGDATVTVHPSLTDEGMLNVEIDGDFTVDGLKVHVNDQRVWDSRFAGGDVLALARLEGADLAEGAALGLADAVREAVLAHSGKNGRASLQDYLNAALERLDELAEDVEELHSEPATQIA